jgi:general stress protein CsbA
MATASNTLEMNQKETKCIVNPWVSLAISLLLIIPSLYRIFDVSIVLKHEYLALTAGFLLMLLSLKKIFENVSESDGFDI